MSRTCFDFNQIRPHEGIDMRRPLDVYLQACNDRQTIKSTEPKPCDFREAGHEIDVLNKRLSSSAVTRRGEGTIVTPQVAQIGGRSSSTPEVWG